MNIEEQQQELEQQAVEIACTTAGYARAEINPDLDTDLIWEIIKHELAADWEAVMGACREAYETGYLEAIFVYSMSEIGVESARKAQVVKNY